MLPVPVQQCFFGLLFFLPLAVPAQTGPIASEKHSFRVETVVEKLDHPWGVVQLPDGRFLATERRGTLRIIEDGKLQPGSVSGVPPVFARGQGGLMDIELHPDFKKNGWIYLAFSKVIDEKKSLTSIIRARLKENALADIETIFDPPAEEATNGHIHFGCRMTFDDKNHLFFSIGDRGDVTTPANNAQRTDNVKGKIHRIHDDGRIPEDNPFVKTPGARPSIWSYGNRNAQGLRIDPATGLLWETEHGPRGGDECNLIKKGANYGWPIVTYGINYSGTSITEKREMEGMVSPVINWTPSIAASGLDVYHGDKFPKWKGNLFAGALAHQKIVRIELDGEKAAHQEILLEKTGRIRDIRCFSDGYIYVVYDDPGKIVRLVPAE
jgi:glucose/arabinose dehydrogenase